ncbi:MAG TPA: ABC transporter permease [Pyrinomonadaceae bacterium]|jgi:putative ABC transport system permease protein
MRIFWQDVRFAMRSMLTSYVFTGVAIITLALGIGANTALFSVASGVLLRSLPFAEPERIVFVWISNPRRQMDVNKLPAPAADFLDWRAQNRSFDKMSAFYSSPFTLTGAAAPERIEAVRATADFFDVLGAKAAKGRTFIAGEDRPGNDRVVILSDGFWKRRFGADPAVVGKTLTLDGAPHEVIGVMPEEFNFPQGPSMPPYLQFPLRPELWAPLSFSDEAAGNRRTFNLATIARLKPGVTVAQAQSDMSGVAAGIDQQYRKSSGYGTDLVEMREQLVGDVRTALLVLLVAAGLVLLVSCVNVSNLLLARSARRQQEMALRSALGARRGRLVRQLLTESVVLALVGGVLGLLLANWGTQLLLSMSPSSIPNAGEIGIDARVLGFTFAAVLLAGVVSGILPALQASRTDLNSLLRGEGRGSTPGARSRRVRNLLVTAEVGLALLLLIGAGLLARSYMLLNQVKLGFDPDKALTMHFVLPDYKYTEDRMSLAFFDQLLPRLAAAPGVESVGLVSNLPLSGAATSITFTIEGQPPPSPQDRPLADYTLVTPGFFDALRIPVVRGRPFGDQDTATSPGVVLINEAMARRYWPGEDAVGKTISVSGGKYAGRRQVVGVVSNVRRASLSDEPRPEMYVPYAQQPERYVYMVVRTRENPLGLAPVVRGEVLAIDRDQPVTQVRTMAQVVTDSESRRRFNLLLMCLFAGLALVLALVGIYGVVAYSVTQRAHEIGIRMALGARPGAVVRLIVRQGMFPALVGTVGGLLTAYALTRVMSSMLYEVSATDPAVFVCASAALLLVALLAIYLPARRITKIDPVTVLRE